MVGIDVYFYGEAMRSTSIVLAQATVIELLVLKKEQVKRALDNG